MSIAARVFRRRGISGIFQIPVDGGFGAAELGGDFPHGSLYREHAAFLQLVDDLDLLCLIHSVRSNTRFQIPFKDTVDQVRNAAGENLRLFGIGAFRRRSRTEMQDRIGCDVAKLHDLLQGLAAPFQIVVDA